MSAMLGAGRKPVAGKKYESVFSMAMHAYRAVNWRDGGHELMQLTL